MIAAVAIAAEPSVLPQLVEPAGDLAAVAAADRLDQVGVEHRGGGERLLDGLEAGRPLEDLRGAPGQRNLPVPPERLGAIEAGLCAGPPSLRRVVHRPAREAF